MDHVVGWLFLGFWVVLCAAVVVRLVLALRRRRSGSSLQDSVLRPVVSTGTLSVWPVRDPGRQHPGPRPEDLHEDLPEERPEGPPEQRPEGLPEQRPEGLPEQRLQGRPDQARE